MPVGRAPFAMPLDFFELESWSFWRLFFAIEPFSYIIFPSAFPLIAVQRRIC
jgi:hypothetical protein